LINVTNYAGTSEWFRINSGGNVGVGCSASTNFQIRYASGNNTYFRNASAASLTAGTLVEAYDNNFASTLPFYIRASQFAFGTDSGGNFIERLKVNDNGLTYIASSRGAMINGVTFNGDNNWQTITAWSNVANKSGGGSILVMLSNHTGVTGGQTDLAQIHINYDGTLGSVTQIQSGLGFNAQVSGGNLQFRGFDGGVGLSTSMYAVLIFGDNRLHTAS